MPSWTDKTLQLLRKNPWEKYTDWSSSFLTEESLKNFSQREGRRELYLFLRLLITYKNSCRFILWEQRKLSLKILLKNSRKNMKEFFLRMERKSGKIKLCKRWLILSEWMGWIFPTSVTLWQGRQIDNSSINFWMRMGLTMKRQNLF